MENSYQPVLTEILKGVDYLIKNTTKNSTKIYNGLVLSKIDNTNKWNIFYNNEIHPVSLYGGIVPEINQTVKVFIPQGNQALSWFIVPNNNSQTNSISYQTDFSLNNNNFIIEEEWKPLINSDFFEVENANGFYLKINDIIIAVFTIEGLTKNGNSSIEISGLPFDNNQNIIYFGNGYFGFDFDNDYNFKGWIIEKNSNKLKPIFNNLSTNNIAIKEGKFLFSGTIVYKI